MSEQLLVIGLGIGDDAADAWLASGLGDAFVIEASDPIPVGAGGSSSVRFTHTASIVASARAERTWTAPGMGQPGQATITLPRTSIAADPAYIDSNGLSLIEILDEGGCGNWIGVGMEPTFTESEIIIPAVQVWGVLAKRVIDHRAALLSSSPGLIVSRALEASIGSVATVHLGANHDGDAPDIHRYEMDGRSPLDVLTEMMQTSGSDLYIDETGGVFWCGQSAYATRHDTLLVAGGNLQNVQVQHQARERVQEVVATAGGQRYIASRTEGDMTAWPAQAAVNVDALGDVLVVAAHAELEQRNQPVIVIEGGVESPLWNIRERDFVKVLVPWDGFTGLCRWCRVISRALSDDSPLMRLQLQVMQPALGTVQTAGAPARQKPPQRPGRDREGGSFAQQWRAHKRLAARLERG